MPLADLALRRSLQYLHYAFSSVPPLGFGTLNLTKSNHIGEVNLVFLFFLVVKPEHAGSLPPVSLGFWGIMTSYFYPLTLI